MKKIIGILLTLSVVINGGAVLAATPSPTPAVSPTETVMPSQSPLPEESVAPTVAPSEAPTVSPAVTPTDTDDKEEIPEIELSDKFELNIVLKQHKYTLAKDVTIELYNTDDELIATKTGKATKDMYSLKMSFDVPQYRMGEKFKIKLVSGLRSLKYYDSKIEEGGMLEVKTYGYRDDKGEYIQKNGCDLNGNTHYDKELCMYVSGNFLEDVSPRARIVDGIAMMPARAIGEAMGLKIKYDKKYDSVVCSVGSDEVIFNANSAYTTIFGKDTFSPHNTVYIEGSLFVPVRTLAEAFQSKLEVLDFDDHLDVIIGESPIVKEYRNNSPVNKNGISSRTDYLVWVSKSDYKVRVYEGSQYHWEMLKEFPCALGAWNTPTITGQFEYIERTQWNYSGYYVGPVLRFHNGYALHSTLLYYDGTEYDGRVGVNISHGCIRLHPQDINWIADTIPMYTRIYITE